MPLFMPIILANTCMNCNCIVHIVCIICICIPKACFISCMGSASADFSSASASSSVFSIFIMFIINMSGFF